MDRVRVGPVKGLKIAMAAFVLSLALFVVVVAGGGYLLTHKSEEGAETHAAVCALVSDLESRTQSTRVFLEEHPHGTPGIPASALRESLHNQERTIDALSVVSCG
ncbi:MAG TPA: hypothetical protein VFJ76_07775 [Solirubrobacterales bacterium]|nr:hypothetical protein [Solirubrobacterales bacterium]